MKKSSLSHKTHSLRILAVLCLFASYLWVAPSQVHALSAGSQDDVLGRGEHLRSTAPLQTDRLSLSISKGEVPQAPGESNPAAPLQQGSTLAVSIVSSPWATVDSTPSPPGSPVPNVFVVEAVVTNTGGTTATNVTVNLNYNENDDWVLLDGENPERVVAGGLASGAAYHAYWLASYPITPSLSHQYTVTAYADNASMVATSDNYYGNPAPGKTVQTRDTLSTGNSGVSQTSADVVVGVAFTMTVKYSLGTAPGEAIFSPVGNLNFDPGAYRLIATKVDLYEIVDGSRIDLLTVPDRVYLPLPPWPGKDVWADVTYTFLALTPTNAQLCPYAVVKKGTASPKYDQFFCDDETSVPVTGTLTLSITKQASSPIVQQNQLLTYTIYYTNTGDLPLSYVWIWDDVDTNAGSIITETIAPPSDPDETTDSRVAWYLDTVPESGQFGSTGTRTFTILIDGDNQYLADHPLLVNHAFLGINPGSLPQNAALTSTVTTTIQVPVLTITKSDYPDPVLVGRLITYTLPYTNSGSAPATNVLITDVVPLNTTYQTCSGGSTCGMSNGVVSWTIGTVPSNTGDTVSFSVLVSDALETGTLIHNEDYGIVADQTGFIAGPSVTTRVSREAGFIDGYAFQDDDGNGLRDAGEVGLSGVTITLPSATVPVTTTDGNGYYHFRVETEGPISVTAALPTGYFRTTPGTVFLESTLGVTRTVHFGYALSTSTFGVIYGTVFNDANPDGVQSGGENGLSGVTVASAEAAISPVTTNQLGQYTLRYNTSGAVTITETNPPSYVSTTPDVVRTNAETGSSGPSPINFGDFLGIQVTGQVFDDANVNGVNDDGAGVSGATVAAGSDSFLTDSSGVYTLYVSISDSNPITVTEMDPAGYVSTNAIPGDGMTRVDANTLRIDSPTSGIIYSSGDFGDVLASQINADIIVVKEANVGTAEVGETITYTYQVTNTGNVTLNQVILSDDRLGSISLGSTSLAPGASSSGTATYVVQESDLPGPLTNTATVTGTPLVGGVVTDTDSESVALSGAGNIYLPIIRRNY